MRRLLLLVGLLALLTLLAAVVARFPQAVGWGLAVLMMEYGFSLIGTEGVDVGAPLYAVSLLVLAELVADLAGARQPSGPGRYRRQAARVLVIAVLTATVASVVVAGAALAGERGAVIQVIGVAAAGVALVFVVVLAAERTTTGDEGRRSPTGQ